MSVELLEGLATTRSIRRFQQRAIPDDDLNRILFAATRAPSGSNRQPFRFLVLRDGDTATRARSLLAQSFRAGWDAKRSLDGYEGLDASTPRGRVARAMQHLVEHVDTIPVIVLACTTPRHGHLIDGASIYPACQNLLLAARGLGYGGVLSGWHLSVEPELKEMCGIPEEVAVAATIPLGVPVGSHGPVRRRPLPDLVYEDRWDLAAPWAEDPPGTRFTG